MRSIFQFFAEKYGWTAQQVGKLSPAQVLLYIEPSNAQPEIITMSIPEARARGVKGII